MARSRRRPRVLAAIDIGSYSVHLLVATVGRRQVAELVDESAFLGLGRTIDRDGGIGPARDELLATLAEFAEHARAFGAERTIVVGTDPLRRAPDAADVIAEAATFAGLDVGVLSQEEEAFIALLGATLGRPVAHETVVVDVGGGSTEIVVARPGQPPLAAGLPLGATRLTGAHVRSDPPAWEAIEAMLRESAGVMRGAPPAAPAELVAVGGTARSLLRVGPPLASRFLSRRRLRQALRLLTTQLAGDIATRFAVRPSRAGVLPAGAAILLAAVERYEVEHLRVAKGGLREGLLLAWTEAGGQWRSRLPSLLGAGN